MRFLPRQRVQTSGRRPGRRVVAGILAVACVVWVPGAVRGQAAAGAAGRARVLHEYFDPWGVDVSAKAGARAPDSPDAQPELSVAPGGAGQPPGLSLRPSADEMILGEDGPVDPGRTAAPWGPLEPGGASSLLDDATDRIDELKYWANFEPSVVPYKRVVVQNDVRVHGGNYAMALDAGELGAVQISPQPPGADEDVFWGSFLLRLTRDQYHPIPSISPQQRLLKVQTAPEVNVRWVRDAADNFYLIPDADGLVRVNIQVAVGRSYFAGELSDEPTWADLGRVPVGRDAQLPVAARQTADAVLRMVGASRQMAPRDAIYRLIEYYRDFDARPFPDAMRGQDLYTAISREQVGVCRHRSLAFVISARALGVPVRYVYNEAHAFVELYWPGTGWRRVDLGGAADEVDYSGRAGAPIHQSGEDVLPMPPNYMSELERMGGSIPGVGASDPSQEPPEHGAGGAHTMPGTGSQALEGDRDDGDDEVSGVPGAHDAVGSAPTEHFSASGQLMTPAPHDARHPVRIDAVVAERDVFLGSAVALTGSVFTEAGRPVSRAQLHVYLGPPGAESVEGLQRLGTMLTDAGGRFEQQFELPDAISIGRWALILRYDGDQAHQPAQVN